MFCARSNIPVALIWKGESYPIHILTDKKTLEIAFLLYPLI